MSEPLFRPTRRADLAPTYAVRASTRENPVSEAQLWAMGITPEAVWAGFTRGDYVGWVCEADGAVVGFCTGDASTGEVLVLAVLPGFERKGIGAKLIASVIEGMRAKQSPRPWLAATADPGARAHGFYRAVGWTPTGEVLENGDEILAYAGKEGWNRMKISIAETESEIRKCFPVIRQLRPHLEEDGFVAQAQRQMRNHGYKLAFIEESGLILAAAGYRVAEYLAWGKILYVDDLITLESERGKGCGARLMDWLMAQAQTLGCAQFHLDSGVQRFDAHRLYLKKRMEITSHHFSRLIARP